MEYWVTASFLASLFPDLHEKINRITIFEIIIVIDSHFALVRVSQYFINVCVSRQAFIHVCVGTHERIHECVYVRVWMNVGR